VGFLSFKLVKFVFNRLLVKVVSHPESLGDTLCF
jgi:hypothetical protein